VATKRGTQARDENGRIAAHVPSDETMKQVTQLAAVGCTQAQIAMLFKIDEDTFRKHYGEEFNRAKVLAIGKVASTLFKRATEGNDLGAAIFYLKAQGGWRETPNPLEGLNGILNINIHM
jgi:uncharacterized protein YhbP (UPF0306 family)